MIINYYYLLLLKCSPNNYKNIFQCKCTWQLKKILILSQHDDPRSQTPFQKTQFVLTAHNTVKIQGWFTTSHNDTMDYKYLTDLHEGLMKV